MRVDRTSQYPPFASSFLPAKVAILPLLEMHIVVMDLQQRVHTIDMNPKECRGEAEMAEMIRAGSVRGVMMKLRCMKGLSAHTHLLRRPMLVILEYIHFISILSLLELVEIT